MGGRDKVLIQFDFLELVIGIFFPLFFFVQSSMYHSSNELLFIFDCVLRNFRTEPEIKSFLSWVWENEGIDLSEQIIESDIRQSNELEYYYHII
jgi:hypothetical protein